MTYFDKETGRAIVAAFKEAESQKGANRRQFFASACALARAKGKLPEWREFSEREYGMGHGEAVAKAAMNSAMAGWDSHSGKVLMDSFLEGIAHRSLLDLALRHAKVLSPYVTRTRMLTGFSATAVGEGELKILSDLTISVGGDAETTKVVGLVVATDELFKSTLQGAAIKLISRELENAVVDASNATLLASLPKITVAPTATVLGDIRAGLAAAAESEHYLAAVSPADALALAASLDDGRMGVTGGPLMPGVDVVSVKGLANTTVIPLSTLALLDLGAMLRASNEATIDMGDGPVSLFQCDCTALMMERSFRLAVTDPAVEVTA